jgi:hypothetical protein
MSNILKPIDLAAATECQRNTDERKHITRTACAAFS